MRFACTMAVGALIVTAAGCGQPASPTVPPPVTTSASAPAITVFTCDRLALIDGTTVSCYASGTHLDLPAQGTGVSYRVDWGDGALDTAPVSGCIPTECLYFAHVYHTTGVMPVSVVVTDILGRTSSASSSTKVVTLSGTWTNTLSNPATGLVESRALTLAQSGPEISGSYTHPAGDRDALHGAVARNAASGTQTISMTLDNRTMAFSGSTLDNDGLIADGDSLRLRVAGGSADGQVLTFARVR